MTILFDQGYANKIALKESEAIGEARGEAKGEARGEARGKAIGAYDKAVSTARNLLEMGLLSIEQIAQATQLPLSEVAAL